MKKTIQSWIGSVVAGLATALFVLPAAHAEDVFISATGRGAGQATGSLVLPVGTGNFWAGMQTVALKDSLGSLPSTSFLAYCIDSAHYATSTYTAFFQPAPVSTTFSSKASTINRLFNDYYADAVSNNANAAAFQLALWEVANDDGNLATGVVRSTSATNSSLLSNASAILNHLSQPAAPGQNLYNLNVYRVDRAVAGVIGQDVIVATPVGNVSPVPEPDAFLLMLAGLGIIVASAFRQRKAAVSTAPNMNFSI